MPAVARSSNCTVYKYSNQAADMHSPVESYEVATWRICTGKHNGCCRQTAATCALRNVALTILTPLWSGQRNTHTFA